MQIIQKEENEKNQEEYFQIQKEEKTKIASQFLDDYLKYMGTFATQQLKQHKYQILRSNNVIIDENASTNSLEFQIIQTDLESFILLLHYADFKIKVNVLMISLTTQQFTGSLVSYGSYGSIYKIRVAESLYAIKKVTLKNYKNFDSSLKQIYKEYFLLYIASVLKIGPKISNPFGYDIIITNNDALFAMEFCSIQISSKFQKMKGQILENLRVMHSLNFVHLDIKPLNLAYSYNFQKCVFLDFGLSQLIKQKIGNKTLTCFVGTLGFCSDEMTNTYNLNKPRPIDLYYNDLVALKTTFQKMVLEENLENFNLDDGDKPSDFFISQKRYYDFERNHNVIEQSVYIFQLKFYIFSHNVENIIKTITTLQIMPNSFFAIINSKTTKRFLEKNQHINHYINLVRKKIMKLKYINLTDSIISSALKKTIQNEGVFKFSLSQFTLNLSNQKFRLILQNQNFVNNILLSLDQFSKDNNLNLYNQKSRIIFKLVKKVNEIFRTKKQQQLTQLYEKVTHFLRFLNSSLKKTSRSYKNLNILRLLFIKMEDLKPVQELEDQIISKMTNPIMKCLKITEFILFWQLAFPKFQYFKEVIWTQVIQKQLKSAQNNKFDNIIRLSMEIIRNKDKRYFQNNNMLKNNKELFCQCMNENKEVQIQDQLQLIQVMYKWSSRFQKQLQIKNPILKIYSVFFPALKFKLTRTFQYTSFDNLFLSYTQFAKRLRLQNNLKQDRNKLQNSIKYAFNICENRTDLINSEFFYHTNNLVTEKKMVILLFDKFYENLSISWVNQQKLIFSKIKSFMAAIQEICRLLTKNKINSQHDRLSQLQLNILSQKLRELILLFTHHIQKIQNIPQRFLSEKIAQIYELRRKIIFIGAYQSIQYEVLSIFRQIHFQNYELSVLASQLCLVLLQLASILPEQRKKPIQDAIVQLCERNIKSQVPYLLQSNWKMFISYIKINIKRNQNNKNRKLVQFAIQYSQKPDLKIHVFLFHSRYTTLLIEAFCNFTNYSFLKNIYDEISFKKSEFSRTCYSFYILFIFQSLYPKWYSQQAIMVKQLKRSCICLKDMKRTHLFIAKGMILNFCNLPMVVESKRKRLICWRMSARSIKLTENLLSRYEKFLKSQVNLIKNSNIRNKLMKKIQGKINTYE